MLNAIALDDEPIALEVIKNLSRKVVFMELTQTFTNSFEALDFLQKHKTDLLFLDIQMPDISGIELLKTITHPPLVIFTTAYSEHAVQSFELDAIDYLLKPFSFSRFLKACNKANEQDALRKQSQAISSAPATIFIKSGYDQIRVDLADIFYVESCGNYVQFVLDKQKIISRLTMSEAETLLPARDFVRIHRSYIVAKRHVSKIEKRSVWIKQWELPMGAGYTQETDKLIS
jgi:DNA-binding LytR/AlgR family response regulator